MPQIIEIQDYPIKITVSEVGIRGPSGAPGQGGGGGNISGFAGVFSINSLSGILNLTGAGGISINNIGLNTIQISGNNAAVINLSGINNIAISQSGQVYFISGVNLITTAQTGQFYPASNPQFYIKSGDIITISGVLQNSLTQSGVILENQINSLSGYSNSTFSTNLNVQNTGQNLYNLITGESGSLLNTINSSGSYLFGLINASSAGVSSLNSHSGALSLTGAGSVNVIVNGQNFTISGSPSQATLTDVLYTSGIQTISGLKTFTTGISVSYISGGVNYIGIIDSNGVLSNDWNNRDLYDAGGIQSASYGIRVLRDGIQNYSVEWGNRFLRDVAQNYVLDWNSLILSGNWKKNGNYILTSLDSGNIQSQINFIQNQPIVTGISINGSSQRLTGYVTFAAGNNDISLGQNTTSIIISVPGLTQTGAFLYNLATGISGQIQLTGSTLDNKINSLSGYSNSTFTTALNVQNTGQNLFNIIKSLSGQFDTTGSNLQVSINTFAINLTNTGSVLDNKINSLSGYSNNSFATINNLQNTGQNLYNLLTGESGSLSARIDGTGSFLFGLINASSAGVSSLNSHSGAISFTGAGNVSVIVNGQNFIVSGDTGNLIGYATVNNLLLTGQQAWTSANNNGINLSGNLQSTGSTLDTKINSLSGYSNTTFTTTLNVQNTGQTLYNLIVGLSGKLDSTGTNLQNQINTLTSNLTQTGVNIESQINSLSGYSNNTFATITNLASTGQQLFIIDTNNANNISGKLQSTGQNLYNLLVNASGGLNSSGALDARLFSTGSNLFNNINGLSGIVNNIITNLQSTGQQTYNLIVGLSGKLDATGTNLQNQINTLTSNLTQTGVTIELQINSLSGYSNSTFATQTNLATTGHNNWVNLNNNGINLSGNLQTTGQNNWIISNNNAINLSGNLQATGSYLLGLIGGSVAGVSSVNSRTGAVLVTGVGTVVVTTTGQIITISGVSPITGGTVAYDFGLINLITGTQNSQFIQFHQNFSTVPNVYGNLINNSGDGIIASMISGTSISGFYINLSEILTTNNYFFDYLATTGVGFYNFALSTINTVIGSSIGNITGSGVSNYIPQFTTNGIGITNSVISGQNTGIYVSGMLTVTDKIIVPNANFRIKDGQMQFWDSGAWAIDSTKPWRALGVFSGATIWSAPILD